MDGAPHHQPIERQTSADEALESEEDDDFLDTSEESCAQSTPELILATAASHASPSFGVCCKWGCLYGFRRLSPKQYARFSVASVACCCAQLVFQAGALPQPFRAPVQLAFSTANACVKPVVVFKAMRLLNRLLPSGRRDRHSSKQYEARLTSSRVPRDSRSLQTPPVVHTVDIDQVGRSASMTMATRSPAAQLALEYQEEIAVLSAMLKDAGVSLPRGRSHPAQLMRFLVSNGILQARTVPMRMAVLKDTVIHLRRHAKWYAETIFLPPTELKKWHPYCRVAGLYQDTVVLEIFIGALIQHNTFQQCQRFHGAVVSLLELVVKKLMAEDGSKPSTLTTLIHVGEVSLVDSMKFLRIGTALAVALNKNYPGRLAKMYVVDLPVSSLWFLQAVMRFVSPHTRRKVVSCSSKDRDLLPPPSEIVRTTRSRPRGAPATPQSATKRPRPHPPIASLRNSRAASVPYERPTSLDPRPGPLQRISNTPATSHASTAPRPRALEVHTAHPQTPPRGPLKAPLSHAAHDSLHSHPPRDVTDSVSSTPSHALSSSKLAAASVFVDATPRTPSQRPHSPSQRPSSSRAPCTTPSSSARGGGGGSEHGGGGAMSQRTGDGEHSSDEPGSSGRGGEPRLSSLVLHPLRSLKALPQRVLSHRTMSRQLDDSDAPWSQRKGPRRRPLGSEDVARVNGKLLQNARVASHCLPMAAIRSEEGDAIMQAMRSLLGVEYLGKMSEGVIALVAFAFLYLVSLFYQLEFNVWRV